MSSWARRSSRREVTILCGAAMIGLASFLLLTSAVWRANEAVALDRLAERYGLGAGRHGVLGAHLRLAHAAEQLGTAKVVGCSAVVVFAVALLLRDPVVASVAVLSPVVCFVVVEYVAKTVINAPIPYGGRAYPSGHAAGVSAVSVSALIMVYRRWGGLATAAASPVALGAIIAVGLGVLALDFHHYATDVLGGAALGGTVALALIALLSLGLSKNSAAVSQMAPASRSDTS